MTDFPVLRPILRRFLPDDEFFALGNAQRQNQAKEMHYGLEEISLIVESPQKNYVEYDQHYQMMHQHKCHKCEAPFCSSRLLHIHFQEHHDFLFKVMAEKQKMYECLIEGCERKFSGPRQRRLHMIDYHKFPKTFFFKPRTASIKPQEAQNRYNSNPNFRDGNRKANSGQKSNSSKKLQSTAIDSMGDVSNNECIRVVDKKKKKPHKKTQKPSLIEHADRIQSGVDDGVDIGPDNMTDNVIHICEMTQGLTVQPTQTNSMDHYVERPVHKIGDIRFGRGRPRGFSKKVF